MPSSIEVALEAVKRIRQELLLYGIVETVLLVPLLAIGRDVPSGLLPIVYALAALATLPLLLAIAKFVPTYQEVKESYNSGVGKGGSSGSIPKRVFDRSDSTEFLTHVEDLMRQAHRIVLIGTGLNVLHKDPFAMEIMSKASQDHCQLEIYLADPTSPAVKMRLIEEELGDMKPPVGQTGLFQRIDTLLDYWKRLRRPNTISINLFTHYPTFAILIVDREYFIYPYGYATLGNFSPVLQFSRDNPADQGVITFLDKQYKRVKASAINAEMAFEIRNQKSVNVNNLCPFAIYFVPSHDSDLYQFGTQVVGYDLREREMKNSTWQEKVGSAHDFGFHLTLCDALYFPNKAEVKSVCAEVEFLSKEFKPFNLTGLRLVSAFPDANSISVVPKDPSGSLEALHHELVQRVYSRAAASNYSLGIANMVRDQDRQRARLMIERYRAPYILQRFRTHFTLMTNVLPEEQSQTYQELKKIFSKQVRKRTIRVENLAIMSRPAPDKPWVIEKEISLG